MASQQAPSQLGAGSDTHSQPSRLLLKGGTVLLHDASDHVNAVKADVLIEGNKIAKISDFIAESSDINTIDCTSKVISPGFIDTHHHMWQTQLKGRHGNEVLLEYMASGNLQSSNYTREDIYWGQLAGCLESINAGTTTVFDHSHINCFPEAASSGIRSVYGYCPTPRVESWSPLTLAPDVLEPWVMNTLESLASQAPFGHGRVTLGFAFDQWFLPGEVIQAVFSRARAAGARLATTHAIRNAQISLADPVERIKSLGLLDSDIVLSHSNGLTTESIRAVADAGAHISSTPSAEMQMAAGYPVCLDETLPGAQKQSSIGIDCHSNQAASVVYEMRLVLQASRARQNQKIVEQGKAPRHVSKTVEEAFNLGTIQGARALGMQDHIGSIAEGKLADLVIFDGNSPELLCAVEQDPVAAIVLHSSIGSVETVIVDGIIRKQDGKIPEVGVEEQFRELAGDDSLTWNRIADELRQSRKGLLKREAESQDLDEVKKGVLQIFYVDQSKLV
ncbi:uncharacterized protein NECHADRAFT_56668 [Fusarium vanettenii 77-13-4]|uniref:Amidohydrolase-related domain-containing protein n=1 Tax=Fusarium vanettenii (strain ATCC MYA-4622 / CBS 123669 / FGSC 9596 / NRRL 45880 / 77-13-4) TaxID=660122 RepID=C7ZRD5_FUSV7|nr:uncharacterized protein NECHADRAFT_56668 [Fusarium vanettenii 77-13-4]EEU33423.1 hypothetical protein NECHADRAFT_56668 [Fusarium vanettenii 77-13-4]